ncbi:MAG TPA: Lrp/AsnC family transcriptional regulator [Candidatus Binataceae bacterium]|nr:Lrp/AsnC family transcriptional regulator [Candidatus Binataceae bacterium]
MKSGIEAFEPDAIDLQILDALQEHGRIPHAKLAEQVGLSAPAVIERVKKLEDGGIITGYHAVVDARRVGRDVTAFIGVSIGHPQTIGLFEETVDLMPDVLECHHVTGEHTVLLKIKTHSTATLEQLIRTIRLIDGVTRTETMVVLSTHTERTHIFVSVDDSPFESNGRRRHGANRSAAESRRA